MHLLRRCNTAVEMEGTEMPKQKTADITAARRRGAITLDRYGHLSPAALDDAAAAFAAYL